MKKRVMIGSLALLLSGYFHLFAQQVVYSPYFRDLSPFQMAGKAGDYYWVQKERSQSHYRRPDDRSFRQLFDVYDERMQLIQMVSGSSMTEDVVKEYLVAGPSYFDQLLLVAGSQTTTLMLQRFSADGRISDRQRSIGSFACVAEGSSVILVRSADRKKLGVFVFEYRPGTYPLLHIILCDDNWNLLSQTTVDDRNITQPCIQNDRISFPIENFDNLPVQLANNGEWFMSTPSRTGSGFLFFHFCVDGQFSYRHIRLPAEAETEDVALQMDPSNTGASVGILSGWRQMPSKQLRVAHYSMATGSVDYDSSFRFNTVAGELHNKHLIRQTLMGLPNGGFLFFKEYGRESFLSPTDPVNSDLLFQLTGTTDDQEPFRPLTKEGFAHAMGLHGLRPGASRGDLSMFYFPAAAGDSAWSGLLHAPQTTEMNWPALSYVVMPTADKLLFLYQSMADFSGHAATTVVDHKGYPMDEGGLVFWKVNRVLDFQHACRMTDAEIAVPYKDRPGFAVIRPGN